MHNINLQQITIGYYYSNGKYYLKLIEPITLRMTGGTKLALVGANGTGKTSLLRLIAGDSFGARILNGSLHYDINGCYLERCPTDKGYAAFAGLASVDYINEHLDFLNVRTILASGRTPSYYYSGSIPKALNQAIEDIAPKLALESYVDADFYELSSGQKMMVVIGRALIAQPQLLVLDEIDQYLASTLINKVAVVLEELRGENSELIILAAAHQQQRNDLYKDFVIKPIKASANRELNIESIGKATVRHPLNKAVTLSIEHSFIRFGLHKPWQLNIDYWQINGGECWYLQGDNGAGKTSLLKAMAGKVPFHADSKAVTLNGFPLHYSLRHDAPLRVVYRGGFISQQRIEDVPELEFTLDEYLRGAEQGVHAIYAANIPISNRTREWLDLTRLTPYLFEEIKVLSSGQRKRFEFVAGVASNAGVLLLDEPFNNLDKASTNLVVEAIQRLRQDGLAIVVTAHDLPHAMKSVVTNEAKLAHRQLKVIY